MRNPLKLDISEREVGVMLRCLMDSVNQLEDDAEDEFWMEHDTYAKHMKERAKMIRELRNKITKARLKRLIP